MAPPFLTSALGEGELTASCPGRFTPGKEPPVPIGQEAGWAPEMVWTLWSRDKSLTPAENRTPAVQFSAHRYTDWAIPAPRNKFIYSFICILYNGAVRKADSIFEWVEESEWWTGEDV
jgi:hypothetical protein